MQASSETLYGKADKVTVSRKAATTAHIQKQYSYAQKHLQKNVPQYPDGMAPGEKT